MGLLMIAERLLVLATLAAVAAHTLVLAAVPLAAQQAPAPPASQQLLVPAYAFPVTEWQRLLAGGPSVSPVVLDVGVGSPGGVYGGANPAARVAEAQRAGLRVVGYVPTAYGKGAADPVRHPTRTLEAVRGYIDEWYRLAPALDGAFFDEGPLAEQQAITPEVRSFYAGIYRHLKARSGGRGTVVLNATESDQEWVMTDASDVAILYEGPAAKYEQRYRAPAWSGRYPPGRIAHVVFEVPSCADMVRVVARSKDAGAGVVYVYDRSPTAYDRLPAHWAAQLRAAKAAHLGEAAANSVADLSAQIRHLQDQLRTASTSEKAALVADIRQLQQQRRQAVCP